MSRYACEPVLDHFVVELAQIWDRASDGKFPQLSESVEKTEKFQPQPELWLKMWRHVMGALETRLHVLSYNSCCVWTFSVFSLHSESWKNSICSRSQIWASLWMLKTYKTDVRAIDISVTSKNQFQFLLSLIFIKLSTITMSSIRLSSLSNISFYVYNCNNI